MIHLFLYEICLDGRSYLQHNRTISNQVAVYWAFSWWYMRRSMWYRSNRREKCLTDFSCEKWWSEFIGQLNGPFNKSMHVFVGCKWVATFQHWQMANTHIDCGKWELCTISLHIQLTLRIVQWAFFHRQPSALNAAESMRAAAGRAKKFGNYAQSYEEKFPLKSAMN